MTHFKHILVPIDFGEASEAALAVAIELATRFESHITLLHVSWLPPNAHVSFAEQLPWPTDLFAQQGERELAKVAARARAHYPRIDIRVVEGEAWKEILLAAKALAADHILMGTHGRRGLPRALLGSVAERVVRLSHIPVTTISGKAEREAKDHALAEL